MKELNTILRVCIGFMGRDFTYKNQRRENVFKRWIYFKICKELTSKSLASIGGALPYKKNHATVIFGLSNFDRDIADDEYYYSLYSRCYLMSKLSLEKPEMSVQNKLLHENINLRQRIKELEAVEFEEIEVVYEVLVA